MQHQSRWANVGLAIVACLFLAACETLGIGKTEAPAPVSAAEVLKGVPEVENSDKSPCWQQRQIAAQRAYIESNVGGKPVMYHGDCSDETKSAAKVEPKTS